MSNIGLTSYAEPANTMEAPTKPKEASFLGLPAEIRLRIYELVWPVPRNCVDHKAGLEECPEAYYCCDCPRKM